MKITTLRNCVLLFCTLSALHTQAQVTIGSLQPPAAGALLDLKTETDGSSKLGLGLPRVILSNLKPTTDADLAKSIGNATGSYDRAAHIGLIVYNVKEGDVCDPASPSEGLHVWDGTTWVGLGVQKDDGTLAPEVYKVTDPRDSEVYLARNFGAAGDWMLENLRYDPIAHPNAAFIDFTHTAVAASSYTAKCYVYAEGDENPYTPANHPSAAWASKKKNGLFYNWAAATNGQNPSTIEQGEGNGVPNPIQENIQQVGVQGICPVNWHVPSDKEWNELEAIFSASTTDYTNSAATPFTWEASYNITANNWRPNSANVFGHGKSMKSLCPPVSYSTATIGDSKTTAAGGFNLLLAGYAGNGSAVRYGGYALLWSSSSSNNYNAWDRAVNSSNAGVARYADGRSNLFSVRCKKNDN